MSAFKAGEMCQCCRARICLLHSDQAWQDSFYDENTEKISCLEEIIVEIPVLNYEGPMMGGRAQGHSFCRRKIDTLYQNLGNK